MSSCTLGTCSSFRCRTSNCPVSATLGEVRASFFEEGKGSLGLFTGVIGGYKKANLWKVSRIYSALVADLVILTRRALFCGRVGSSNASVTERSLSRFIGKNCFVDLKDWLTPFLPIEQRGNKEGIL